MEYNIKSIVFVPQSGVIQALINFSYKGKNEYAVMNYNTADYPHLTTDVKVLPTTDTFNTLALSEIEAKKTIIDSPEV